MTGRKAWKVLGRALPGTKPEMAEKQAWGREGENCSVVLERDWPSLLTAESGRDVVIRIFQLLRLSQRDFPPRWPQKLELVWSKAGS